MKEWEKIYWSIATIPAVVCIGVGVDVIIRDFIVPQLVEYYREGDWRSLTFMSALCSAPLFFLAACIITKLCICGKKEDCEAGKKEDGDE